MLKVQVIGNLGADAELQEKGGKKFVTFKIAHSDRYTKEDGTKVDSTTWVSCLLNWDDGKLLMYLKKGVKVFVTGRLNVRVYSSPKLKCMVAGIDCNVDSIELCGGSTDDVPRSLVVPETGAIVPVTKLYWLQQHEGITQLIGEHGGAYNVDANGFISVAPMQDSSEQEANDDDKKQNANGKRKK